MIGTAGATLKFGEVRQGMKARVVAIGNDNADLRRLQEMGLTVGTEFKVLKIAPFGDPVEISLRGYRLCLRKKETLSVLVEEVE